MSLKNEKINRKIAESSSQSSKRVVVVVTAFGPFGGVQVNPSMTLLHELSNFLKEYGGWKGEVEKQILESIIVETSAEGVKKEMKGLADRLDGQEDQQIICLHLGVNVFAKWYQLETSAYNDASFRIPDERNYKPQKQRIIEDQPIGNVSRTKVDVPHLVEHLTTVFPACESRSSIDPGRFVCNYLYYTSLNLLQDKYDDCASLFLHIPPFEVVPKEIQLEYLAELLRILVNVNM